MVKSQVVTLEVFYEDDGFKHAPSDWNWSELIDEPITNSVKVLAGGTINTHPFPSDLKTPKGG
jgi:hypothetical protein